MVITSLDNSKVAQAKKLLEKKYRVQLKKYLIEGERLVSDAISHGALVETVFVKQSVASKFNFENQIVLADNVFAKICDTVTTQGVVAVVSQVQRDLQKPTGHCLVLDGLQDPGNIGTLLRTAVACGFSDVYAVNSADLYSPKVLRSAMSAHFCINLHQSNDLQQVFDVLEQSTIVCADMQGQNAFDYNFDGKIALVLGNEGNGLSPLSRQTIKQKVSLPMQNNLESLNVAVAGSVIMYCIYAKGN